VRIGLIVPQGWTGEFAGWNPSAAWARTVEIAGRAEAAGYESIWAFDHFHTTPDPTNEMTFESFTTLTSLAAVTERIRLGHIVTCVGFRNPALVAKMASTLDVVSGGRFELGLGAGWKREEWLAYGYGFPTLRERLELLEDAARIAHEMLGPGRATVAGRHASVDGAINLPKPLQERLPIMIGGNGREVTWRIAARWADELNLDGMLPEEVAAARPVMEERWREAGRDPASLRVSVHIWWDRLPASRPERVAMLRGYREAGVGRVMTLLRTVVSSPDEVERLAGEAFEAGVELVEGESARPLSPS
jgi:F420-dependent oxidoreductase-like protein